jgi:hypothetical protein
MSDDMSDMIFPVTTPDIGTERSTPQLHTPHTSLLFKRVVAQAGRANSKDDGQRSPVQRPSILRPRRRGWWPRWRRQRGLLSLPCTGATRGRRGRSGGHAPHEMPCRTALLLRTIRVEPNASAQ